MNQQNKLNKNIFKTLNRLDDALNDLKKLKSDSINSDEMNNLVQEIFKGQDGETQVKTTAIISAMIETIDANFLDKYQDKMPELESRIFGNNGIVKSVMKDFKIPKTKEESNNLVENLKNKIKSVKSEIIGN